LYSATRFLRYALRSLLRWAFARLYREFAWSYDLVAWAVSRGLWRRWALCSLAYLHGRVLELGPGTGYVQAALVGDPLRPTVGLEASPQMVRQASRRLARRGAAAPLIRGIAQAMPLAAASFDSVLATFPAEYILDPQTASEIRRVLAPGGRVVIVDGAQLLARGEGSPPSGPMPPHVRALEAAGFRFSLTWEAVDTSWVMVLVGALPAEA
jgi:ubiquinone/menaquinone biosynthesis C-methylase UbiE